LGEHLTEIFLFCSLFLGFHSLSLVVCADDT
jgi:hypothetical protein